MSRRLWWIATGIVAIAIVTLSSIPADDLARTGIRIWDKAAHAGVWAVLAYCLRRGLGPGRMRTPLAIALAIAYGVLDEIHQGFTPGREPSASDVVADAIGACVGAWLASRSRRL
jgi:VanZ family protein